MIVVNVSNYMTAKLMYDYKHNGLNNEPLALMYLMSRINDGDYEFNNRTGVSRFCISYEDVAVYIKVSKQTVMRYFKKLVGLGYLSKPYNRQLIFDMDSNLMFGEYTKTMEKED